MASWMKINIKLQSPDHIEETCGILAIHDIEEIEIIDPTENLRFLNEGEEHNWDYAEDDILYAKGPIGVRFFLSKEEADAKMPAVAEALQAIEGVTIEQDLVEDDWSEAWKQHYKPFKVGESIIIRPFWEDYDAKEGEIVFTIDPGHVFGTGQHQSTSLCICLLEKHLQKGDAAFDIGCGSGILATIGLLLGASHTTAIDIDPAAIKMTNINAELNHIDKSKIKTYVLNPLRDPMEGCYDLVVANIVADVIIPLSPLVAKVIKVGSKFICGGIIDDREEEVTQALQGAGFDILEITKKDNWLAYASVFRG